MKMQDSIFRQLEFKSHISKILVACVDSLDKRMVHPNGLKVVKGAHSLGQRDKKKYKILVGNVVAGQNLQNYYYYYF
jgi:hypothetical protein